jgi:NAD(P)-dependent dehydrogenase (short-subunit alcohol dehydrogenase family)
VHIADDKPRVQEQQPQFARKVDVALEIADVAIDRLSLPELVVQKSNLRALLVRVVDRSPRSHKALLPVRIEAIDIDFQQRARRCLERCCEHPNVWHCDVHHEPAPWRQELVHTAPDGQPVLEREQVRYRGTSDQHEVESAGRIPGPHVAGLEGDPARGAGARRVCLLACKPQHLVAELHTDDGHVCREVGRGRKRERQTTASTGQLEHVVRLEATRKFAIERDVAIVPLMLQVVVERSPIDSVVTHSNRCPGVRMCCRGSSTARTALARTMLLTDCEMLRMDRGRQRSDTLRGKVVVITGASGGIGRAAALEFAGKGCRVVLAARRMRALEETAALCRARGGQAHVVVTDVTIEADLQRLRDDAIGHWGRIDVWVNNAGTTYFARLDDGDLAAHRRVIDTNLIAPFIAARLVLPVFRQQRAGTLINIGSVLSQVGQPFVPAYVVSKFGLRGLSDAVRADVADIPGITVSTVLPYTVDTPHFQDAANATGMRAHALPPVQEPERIARAIVDVAIAPRRQLYVPRYVAAGVAMHWLWPDATERLLRHALRTFHLVGRQPVTNGNLFSPASAAGTVHGNRRPVIGRTLFAMWVAGAIATMGARWLQASLAWPGQRSMR